MRPGPGALRGPSGGRDPAIRNESEPKGAFAIREEYPGDAARGKPVFVHRIRDDPGSNATTLRPGKTQSGDPGFAVALTRGSLGACTYTVHVHNGKFVVAAKGLKG